MSINLFQPSLLGTEGDFTEVSQDLVRQRSEKSEQGFLTLWFIVVGYRAPALSHPLGKCNYCIEFFLMKILLDLALNHVFNSYLFILKNNIGLYF